MIEILAPGPSSLLQDLGRPGHADLGVSPSGAADRAALRLANRLVGNPEGATAIETVLGGLRLRCSAPGWLGVVGAAPVLITGAGRVRRVEPGASAPLAAADEVTVTLPSTGLRTVLAFRGGLDVPPVLGSASTDVLSGLGPAPLTGGTRIALGRPVAELPDTAFVPPRPVPTVLTVSPGPRLAWFAADAWAALLATRWTTTADSDRVAVRLDGDPLIRTEPRELPSEGVVRGAVQVPASGRPVLFGADHPVTGGYPVIAVLDDASCDAAAQLRPGDPVRFGGRRPAGRSR